jgi:hypothetical protein
MAPAAAAVRPSHMFTHSAGDPGGLPWTRAVVCEAMQLYPPAWTVERDALAEDTVAGVTVSAGKPGRDLTVPGAPAPGLLARVTLRPGGLRMRLFHRQ